MSKARDGGTHRATNIDPKMMIDIQTQVSRLVAKAGQLIGNSTTNLAECWMHMRTKFDGGKVINRSRSGSFEHRCMGAGLRMNLGPSWGPTTWESITGSQPSNIFSQAAEANSKKVTNDRKRKSTDAEKINRRKRKYAKTSDDSLAARQAYSRHDNGEQPQDISDDVPPDHLQRLKMDYYEAHVVVDQRKRSEIEQSTRGQSMEQNWYVERRKRITASKAGAISKMRKGTKRANKVKELLYTKFRGNKHTSHGTANEEASRQAYAANMQQNGHPQLQVTTVGLVISEDSPWLAASPDGRVFDPSSSPPDGLIELKNPSTAKDMTITEACEKIKGFCIKSRQGQNALDTNHDYFYQVQCQLYCTQTTWCDFVIRTNKDLYIERIYRNDTWWQKQLLKLKTYFEALLPELACPRYNSGGIREPTK